MTQQACFTTTWSEPGAPLDELRTLVSACLDRDGGLPSFVGDELLSARLLSGDSVAVRDGTGRLVAAGCVSRATDTAATSGVVHPDVRGSGLGRQLMAWAIGRAGGLPLTVLTESCSPDARRLYARFGLAQTFAEIIMRHDLQLLPDAVEPAGVRLTPVARADLGDLFTAYTQSFADRPGFIAPRARDWLAELAEPEFRPDLSLVAHDGAGAPVGFITVLGRWIDQVGVVPCWRGCGVGAHLVSRALRALAAEENGPVWLCVNTNNAAADLYRSLGFRAAGQRARFS